MRVTNENLSLAVSEDGDPSAPPILLLHGIIGSGRTWNWLVPALAERFRVLRLDFRGHGESDRAPNEYTVDGYVSDAVAALEQAAGQQCVVIGHSLGGATAAAIAQRRPDLLTGAVLEDPPLGPTTAGEVASLEGHALLEGFTLLRESIPQLQEAQVPLDTLVGMLAVAPDTSGIATFGDILHSDALETMARSMLDVDATVLDPVLAGTLGSFLDPTVPLAVPTLLVAADPAKPDSIATTDAVRHYAKVSNDVEVITMTGVGHLIHDEKAGRDQFGAAVLTFLDRLPAA